MFSIGNISKICLFRPKRRQNENYLPEEEVAGEVQAERTPVNVGDCDDVISSGAESEDEDVLDLVTQQTYGDDDIEMEKQAEQAPRAVLVRRSRGNHGNTTLNVNVFNGEHFSYIKSLNGFANSWLCTHCERLFYKLSNYRQHLNVCDASVKEVFPGYGWGRKPNLFEEMADMGWHVPKEWQYYKYMATYDFETRFKKVEQDEETPFEVPPD